MIDQALNRANARQAIFDDDGDYAAFVRVLDEVVARHVIRLLAYCVMPNHFHLVLDWQASTAARLGLASTLRPRGRPRKEPNNGS